MATIRVFQVGDELDLSNLIKCVYDEFVAPDYSKAGNDFFYDFIVADCFVDRINTKDNIILVAECDNLKIGMIEVRDNNHISLLFVDKHYHGQGIARELFVQAVKMCKMRDKDLDKFYVHASPYSVPIYQKLGFHKTNEIQEQFGIKYIPMEMMIA